MELSVTFDGCTCGLLDTLANEDFDTANVCACPTCDNLIPLDKSHIAGVDLNDYDYELEDELL